jgi:hypothetical protein
VVAWRCSDAVGGASNYTAGSDRRHGRRCNIGRSYHQARFSSGWPGIEIMVQISTTDAMPRGRDEG